MLCDSEYTDHSRLISNLTDYNLRSFQASELKLQASELKLQQEDMRLLMQQVESLTKAWEAK